LGQKYFKNSKFGGAKNIQNMIKYIIQKTSGGRQNYCMGVGRKFFRGGGGNEKTSPKNSTIKPLSTLCRKIHAANAHARRSFAPWTPLVAGLLPAIW